MNTTVQAADTLQEGWLLELHDDAQPTYFSARTGRDQASPAGGWTSEKGKALAFARSIDATNFMKTFLPHMDGVAQIKHHLDLRGRA